MMLCFVAVQIMSVKIKHSVKLFSIPLDSITCTVETKIITVGKHHYGRWGYHFVLVIWGSPVGKPFFLWTRMCILCGGVVEWLTPGGLVIKGSLAAWVQTLSGQIVVSLTLIAQYWLVRECFYKLTTFFTIELK